MKAVVITKSGGPDVLQLMERATPSPETGHVLIKVRAAGVNRPDIFQRKGNYPSPPGIPADIPGLEVAGTIKELGASVTRWKVGDNVCALLGGGGYAEYAVAAEGHCLPMPNGWDFAQSASLPETVFTVWHNVFQRGKLSEGEHLLVHGGSSGIGITAIQLAKASGARVTVTAGTAEKCEACLRLGADRAINYRQENFEEVLKEDKVDVILDMIGGDYISKNINILREDGRLVFINAMKGGEILCNAIDIMRRRLTITGSTLRPRASEFKSRLAGEIQNRVWPIIESRRFQPVIFKTFDISAAGDAHILMESSAHIGKIVLTIP